MAESSFSNFQAPVLPGVVDPSLAQKTIQQINPQYAENMEAIRQAEDIVLPTSKLDTKMGNLNKKLFDKQQNNTGQPPEPTGDGNYLKLFASSLTTNTAGIVDTGAELAATGLNKLASAFGREDLYTKEDARIAGEVWDPLTNQQNVDKMYGYDRTEYQGKLESMQKDVHEGNYLSAFGTALTAAPDALAESMGFMLPLMVGGSAKAIGVAGKAASARSAMFGGSKAMQATAAKAAMKTARADLGVIKGIANLAKENAGLIAMSGKMTKDQNEEFAKNNGGEGMSPEQMLRATAINIAFNALDRFTFKSIIKGGGAKELKQVWGKIPAPERKQIIKKIAQLPADMGKEAAQEYVQQWSEIVNETWGTKDKENLSAVLSDDLKNEDAIVAAMLGASSGGLMSTPKTIVTTLNEAGKGKKERANIEAEKSVTKAGYDTAEQKAKHQSRIDENYEDDKGFFKALEKAEKDIKDINENKELSDSDKVSQIQEIMSFREGLSDKAENARIMAFGQEEYGQLHGAISSHEGLKNDEYIQEQLKEISSDKLRNNTKRDLLVDLVNKIKKINTDNNVDMDMSSIDSIVESTQASMDRTAADIVKRGDSEITYSREKADANKRGSITKSVSESISAKAEPKTEADIDYDDLMKLDDDALTEKMSEYDNKTIHGIMKEARKRGRLARKTEKNELSHADVGRLKKAWTNAKRAVVPSTAKKINKIGNATIKQRAAVKETYDPTKSIPERLKQAKVDLKKFFSKAAVDAKKTAANKTEEVKKTAEQKTPDEIKNAVKAVKDAASDLMNVEDMPLLKEIVTDLKDAGHFAEKRATAILNKIKDFEKEHKVEDALKDIDVETMRSAVKNEYNDLKKSLKDMNKEDAEKAIKAFITKMGSKMNKTEREVLASTLASLQNAGTISKEFAEDTFQNIMELIKGKPVQGPMTVEEAAAAKVEAEKEVKTTQESLLDFYKKAKAKAKELSEKNREEFERDLVATGKKAKRKAGKIVEGTKEYYKKSEGLQAIAKDAKALLTVLGSKTGEINLSKMIRDTSAWYTSQDFKKTILELGAIDENGNKLSIVDKIVDENGKPLVETKEEGC